MDEGKEIRLNEQLNGIQDETDIVQEDPDSLQEKADNARKIPDSLPEKTDNAEENPDIARENLNDVQVQGIDPAVEEDESAVPVSPYKKESFVTWEDGVLSGGSEGNTQEGAAGEPLSMEDDAADDPAVSRTGGELPPILRRFPRLIILLAVLMIGAAVYLFFGIKRVPAELDLTDYTEVKFTGYDTFGYVKNDFNRGAFTDAVIKCLKDKNVISMDYVRGAKELPDDAYEREKYQTDTAAIDAVTSAVTIHIDTTEDLTNGDVIHVTYDYDNSELKKYRIRLTGTEKEYVVSDLPIAQTFDAFASAELSFDGYNGYGTAALSDTKNGADHISYSDNAGRYLENGDVVTVTAATAYGSSFKDYCNEYGRIPKSTTKQYTVSGLPEVEIFDAFACVTPKFEGISPVAAFAFEISDEAREAVEYEADKTEKIANGDIITLKIKTEGSEENNGFDEAFIRKYGCYPKKLSNTYTAEKLPKYLESYKEIPEDILNQMRKIANSEASRITKYNNTKLRSVEYAGTYLLSNYDADVKNKLYIAYRCHGAYTIKADKKDKDAKDETVTFSFMTYAQFMDIVIDDDGSCQVDLDNYNTTSNVITVEKVGDFEGFRTAAEMTDYIKAINEGYSFEQVD